MSKSDKKGLAETMSSLKKKPEKAATDVVIVMEGEGWRIEKNRTTKVRSLVVSAKHPDAIGAFTLAGFGYALSTPELVVPVKDIPPVGVVILKSLTKFADVGDITAQELVEYVQRLLDKARGRVLESVRANGTIAYSDLATYFCRGTEVYFAESGPATAYGALVVDVYDNINSVRRKGDTAEEVKGDNGICLVLETIEATSKSTLVRHEHFFRIPRYSGEIPIESLPLSIIDTDSKDKLILRGRTWYSLVKDRTPKYMTYSGCITTYSIAIDVNSDESGTTDKVHTSEAAGRVVVDSSKSGTQRRLRSSRKCAHNIAESFIEIPDELSWRCSPVVYGYSLELGVWGDVYVSLLNSKVVFNKGLMDRVTLDVSYKTILTCLAKARPESTIVLLHGESGVGKYTTAAALAEIVERPLVRFNTAKLGQHEALKNFLALAASWGAIVLLDNLGSILEKAWSSAGYSDWTSQEAHQAELSQLLTNHPGMVIVTSTKMPNVDTGYFRHLVTIPFERLNVDGLKSVWLHACERFGVKLDVEDLALAYDYLNGHQVVSILRVAMSIAAADNSAVCRSHIEMAAKIIPAPVAKKKK